MEFERAKEIYMRGIRVPLIAYWKNKINLKFSYHISGFQDIMSTFGNNWIQTPKGLDGISFLPHLYQKTSQSMII